MIAPILAACAAVHAFWVGPVEVHGPYFPQEIKDIRAAVAERLARLPGACALAPGVDWEALARGRQTRPGGPTCAGSPDVRDLVALRTGARPVYLTLDGGDATFALGDVGFEVALPADAPGAWADAIARAEPTSGGSGGGGRGLGLRGEPIGVAVDAYTGWGRTALPEAPTLALAAAFARCREAGPRDPRVGIGYTLVAALRADGSVERAAHQAGDGSPAARACLVDALAAHRFPPGTARRAVVFAVDAAPAPVVDAGGITNLHLDDPPPLFDTTPFYEAPALDACPLPEDEGMAFELAVSATGAVTAARAPGVPEDGRACVEAALRTVRFPCPEGGALRLTGTISHR